MAGLGEKPTVLKLKRLKDKDGKRFELYKRISQFDNFDEFVMGLLEDDNGVKLKHIRSNFKDPPSISIVEAGFDKWISSSSNCTYKFLIETLKESDMKALANELEEIVAPKTEKQPTLPRTSRNQSTCKPTQSSELAPDALLGTKDLREIVLLLKELVEWEELGLGLGLRQSTLKSIKIEQHEDVGKCRTEVINRWLKQQDDVKKVGMPSWRVLITELRRHDFGTIADEIMENKPWSS